MGLHEIFLFCAWSLLVILLVAIALAAYPVYRILSIARSGQLRNPQAVWNALQGIAIVRWARSYSMTYLVARINPFSAAISYTILDINLGHASAVLKDQARIRNPFHSVHAAAIILFAETLAGLAVLTTLTDFKKQRCILTSIHADFLKKGRGLLTGTASLQTKEVENDGAKGEGQQGLQRSHTESEMVKNSSQSPDEKLCTVVVKDQDLVTVAKISTYWKFGTTEDKKRH